MVGVTIPRVTLRSTLGYEPLAPLGHSTFQVALPVVLPRIFTARVCGFLPRIFTELGTDFHRFFRGCGMFKMVTISLSEAVRHF